MMKVLLLLLGGAMGTGCRYGLSTFVQKSMLCSFPLGILSVNIAGSFLIGLCWSLAETLSFSVYTRAFLFTGFFGGFTTFSTFTLDTAVLLKNGAYKMALLNVAASNLLGLVALFLGMMLGKNWTNLR